MVILPPSFVRILIVSVNLSTSLLYSLLKPVSILTPLDTAEIPIMRGATSMRLVTSMV